MPKRRNIIEYIRFPWANVTEIGLDIFSLQALAEDYSLYEELFEYLTTMETASQWGLGDAYIAGTIAYRNLDASQAVPNTKTKIKTLQNYAWVCRRYKYSQRMPELSFSHHAVVAKLPHERRVYWLKRALEEDWIVEILDDETREERGTTYAGISAYNRICGYYNDMLRFYSLLPEKPEKSVLRHALKVLEDAIQRTEAAFGLKKAA